MNGFFYKISSGRFVLRHRFAERARLQFSREPLDVLTAGGRIRGVLRADEGRRVPAMPWRLTCPVSASREEAGLFP